MFELIETESKETAMNLATTDNPTMSSREMADLTEKRHDSVKRTIEMLAEKGVIGVPQSVEYLDTLGRATKEYRIGKRDSYIIVAQLSPEFTAKLVDRWQALEQKTALDPMKVLSDPAAMRGLLLTYTEKVLTLESKVEELTPKAEALDRMSLADGEVCLQTAGKLLQQPPNKFIAWMRGLGTWIFKRQGSSRNSAYTDKINAGYLNVRTVTTIMPDGSERVTEQVVVTPKGLAKLAQMLGVQVSNAPFGGAS